MKGRMEQLALAVVFLLVFCYSLPEKICHLNVTNNEITATIFIYLYLFCRP